MTRAQLIDLAKAKASKYGLPLQGFVAQIAQESNWDPNAVNASSGAQGLGQFMPATWAEWGQDQSPFDPDASLDAAARYMVWIVNWLQGQGLQGNWSQALASYNWGIGNVRNAVRTYGPSWLQYAPAETRQYVAKIEPKYSGGYDPPLIAIAVVSGLLLWGVS